VRRLQAVDHPALHHIVDCLVFPAKGERPHTSECSGSDLDGDRYLYIRDPRLVPEKNYPAGSYPAPKPQVVDVVTTRDIIKFFVDYIQNDALGMIAHSHMAIADRESPDHKDCLKLVQLHSIAVDFPKSGVPAQMMPQLRPNEYPDFMEKRFQNSYQSVKVIGIMYRQVAHPTLILQESWDEVQVDPELIYPDFEEYMEEAIRIKKEYNFNLRSIMNQFGVRHESEAMSGHILNYHKHLRNKEYETTQTVRKAVHSLRYMWRDEFFREFLNPDFKGQSVKQEQKKKASAWYLATYERKYSEKNLEETSEKESEESKGKGKEIKVDSLGVGDMSLKDKQKEKPKEKDGEPHEDFLLSFPWVVHDVLSEIKNERNLPIY